MQQQRRRLPPLNALKAFESAARLGGFTAAAEELFVSPGAISRHVANLEAFLNVSLFKRRRNEVRLTNAGAAYLIKIQDALDVIEDASSPTAPSSAHQKLHVNCLPTLAERWLIPLLPGFLEDHPNAQLQITTSLEETDWDTDRADISIYTSLEGLIDRGSPLFETTVVPVCSPAWRARYTAPPSPHDLLSAVLMSSFSRRTDWLRWLNAAGLQVEGVLPQLTFGNSAQAYHAAKAGLGAVCAERELVAADLASGALVEISNITIPGSIYFVEIRPDKRRNALTEDFSRWLFSLAQAQGK